MAYECTRKETGSGTVRIALAMPIFTGLHSTVSALNCSNICKGLVECFDRRNLPVAQDLDFSGFQSMSLILYTKYIKMIDST
jgi:hypothetical protein